MPTFYGKYEVIDQVGEGGFGRVFRAVDPVLKRAVAIKTCTVGDTAVRARFVREAEIVANLKHRHIVTVHDFGVEGEEPFLVQEYLGGQDLREILDEGTPVDLATRIRWLRQVADALNHAHSKGVVHRDIKPSNVRIEADGDVRVMDFGIAKLLGAAQQLTETGTSLGTMGYLAPEQLLGLEVDHRADIFSFGVLAYELLSGQQAFGGGTVTAVIYRIAHEEPPPLRELFPKCPTRLVDCVNVCLEKDRDRRWSDFALVIAELDAVAQTLPRAATGIGARASRAPLILVGLGIVAAGGAAFAVLKPSRAVRPAIVDSPRVAPMPPRDISETARVVSAGTVTRPTAAADTSIRIRPAIQRTRADVRDAPAVPTPVPVVAANAQTTTVLPAASPLDMRRLIVLVRQESRTIQDAIAAAITSELQGAGFTIVDDAIVDATRSAGVTAQNAFAALGRTHGAGFVVSIDGTSEAVPFSGMYTGVATITARVYDARNGSLAGTERGSVGSGGTPGKLGGTPSAAMSDASLAAAAKILTGIRRLVESR